MTGGSGDSPLNSSHGRPFAFGNNRRVRVGQRLPGDAGSGRPALRPGRDARPLAQLDRRRKYRGHCEGISDDRLGLNSGIWAVRLPLSHSLLQQRASCVAHKKLAVVDVSRERQVAGVASLRPDFPGVVTVTLY